MMRNSSYTAVIYLLLEVFMLLNRTPIKTIFIAALGFFR